MSVKKKRNESDEKEEIEERFLCRSYRLSDFTFCPFFLSSLEIHVTFSQSIYKIFLFPFEQRFPIAFAESFTTNFIFFRFFSGFSCREEGEREREEKFFICPNRKLLARKRETMMETVERRKSLMLVFNLKSMLHRSIDVRVSWQDEGEPQMCGSSGRFICTFRGWLVGSSPD